MNPTMDLSPGIHPQDQSPNRSGQIETMNWDTSDQPLQKRPCQSTDQESGNQTTDQESGNQSTDQESGNQTTDQESGNQCTDQEPGDQTTDTEIENQPIHEESDNQPNDQELGNQSTNQESGNQTTDQVSGNQTNSTVPVNQSIKEDAGNKPIGQESENQPTDTFFRNQPTDLVPVSQHTHHEFWNQPSRQPINPGPMNQPTDTVLGNQPTNPLPRDSAYLSWDQVNSTPTIVLNPLLNVHCQPPDSNVQSHNASTTGNLSDDGPSVRLPVLPQTQCPDFIPPASSPVTYRSLLEPLSLRATAPLQGKGPVLKMLMFNDDLLCLMEDKIEVYEPPNWTHVSAGTLRGFTWAQSMVVTNNMTLLIATWKDGLFKFNTQAWAFLGNANDVETETRQIKCINKEQHYDVAALGDGAVAMRGSAGRVVVDRYNSRLQVVQVVSTPINIGAVISSAVARGSLYICSSAQGAIYKIGLNNNELQDLEGNDSNKLQSIQHPYICCTEGQIMLIADYLPDEVKVHLYDCEANATNLLMKVDGLKQPVVATVDSDCRLFIAGRHTIANTTQFVLKIYANEGEGL